MPRTIKGEVLRVTGTMLEIMQGVDRQSVQVDQARGEIHFKAYWGAKTFILRVSEVRMEDVPEVPEMRKAKKAKKVRPEYVPHTQFME